MESYSKYGINIPATRTSGQYRTVCPQCSSDRKKKTEKCLSVNLDKKVWNCQHCSWKGFLKAEAEKRNYVLPKWTNNTILSDKLITWFKGRGIGQQTLIEMKITEGKEFMPQTAKEENTIQFNYFRNDILINTKYRSGNKAFKLVKDSELIFYNIDCMKNFETVFIVFDYCLFIL